MQSWKMTVRLAGALVTLLVLATPAQAASDLELELRDLSAAQLGRNEGATRIALGEVVDDGFSESPNFLGMGPQATYAVLTAQTRQESVERAISHLLQETSLLAASPSEATYVLDVRIVRLRFFIHQTFGRFRLRSEVFIEFSFRKGDEVVGRVLACGNSQNQAQVASKKKVEATYQFGFDDALYKLLRSDTFLRLVGDGWKAGSGSAVGGEYNIDRISRDRFYGPSDLIRTEIGKARKVLKPGVSHIVLQDFDLKDDKYESGKDADPDFARTYLPELVREHLHAFFPGAFDVVEKRKEWEDKEGAAVLTGDLLRFKVGSYLKRALIGFGAGKDKLEATVVIKNGADGKDLFKMSFADSNWGAGWQIKRGQIRDMADQLARDLAYFLVKSLVGDYSYPADLEVCFDGAPYPEEGGP